MRSATSQRILVLLLSLLATGAIDAQFREDIEIRLVEIDVVVTDREGHHVHGLRKEDFVVFESGDPRKITNFTEYGSEPATVFAETVKDNSAAVAASALEQPNRAQNLLILLDPLPRKFLVRQQTFARLDEMLDKLMRDGDRVSIVSWSSRMESATAVLASTDREAVREALREISGVETAGGRAQSLGEITGVEEKFFDETQQVGGLADGTAMQRSSEYFRGVAGSMSFIHKIREMKRLVRSLAAGPGKKTVLYVSDDFGIPSGIPQNVSKEPPPLGWAHLARLAAVEDLVRTANAGSVTFYAVGAYGAPDPSDDFDDHVAQMVGLRELTLPTGGLYDFGVGSINTIATAVSDDVSSYYSLAYQTAGAGNDREHSIRVQTKNPAYRVRAREMFLDKSKETEARDALLAGFFGGRLPDDVEFSLSAPETRGRSTVTIAVTIPSAQLVFAPEGRERVALVRVIVASSNGSDAAPLKEIDLRVVAGRDDPDGVVKCSFNVVLGSGDLTIGVLDRRNGHVGAQTIGNHR